MTKDEKPETLRERLRKDGVTAALRRRHPLLNGEHRRLEAKRQTLEGELATARQALAAEQVCSPSRAKQLRRIGRLETDLRFLVARQRALRGDGKLAGVRPEEEGTRE